MRECVYDALIPVQPTVLLSLKECGVFVERVGRGGGFPSSLAKHGWRKARGDGVSLCDANNLYNRTAIAAPCHHTRDSRRNASHIPDRSHFSVTVNICIGYFFSNDAAAKAQTVTHARDTNSKKPIVVALNSPNSASTKRHCSENSDVKEDECG